ncbi:hypothetical protein C7441_12170 [Pseudaminobacter salicylatoxidans]|uniref:Uncharacterized protein n=1 Tax=Pseudaminobacter salicylatoxidans TaxID=93369 RepID=A0A316BPW0_PSESE|nr:hypothetical protein [Pseudaminobacter salicylatoxidans]PWJ75287.1 hypothetical protein C7441_12170 [Pseudaminobacter salicylatoxidans]
MSSLPVNGARGEVALRVGTVDLVIACEIGRLAAVSTALDCKSFVDLYQRLLGAEVAATMAAIQHLTVKGDAGQAAQELRLTDFAACKNAFTAALMHHIGEDEGKAEAVEEGKAATKTSPSRSATG